MAGALHFLSQLIKLTGSVLSSIPMTDGREPSLPPEVGRQVLRKVL